MATDVLRTMTDIDEQTIWREAKDWLVRLTSGDATHDDLCALDAWRNQSTAHAEALVRASRFWKELGPAVAAVAAVATREHGRAAPRRERRVSRRGLLAGGFCAAGAVAAVAVRPPLGLWPSLSDLAADYRTGTGQQRRVAVDAGISVELNTATSLNLRHSGSDSRIELISGEAVVATTKPEQYVTVLAHNGRVSTFAQTVFSLRCGGDRVKVTCLEGEVQVAYGDRVAILRRQQQIAYDGQGLGGTRNVDGAVVTSWRQGMLVFQNDPLVDVIEEVNRYRRGRIVLTNADLGNRLVTARFRLDRLDDVVVQVSQVFGARVRSLPGDIIFLS